ncbi:MAG: hypothetical protein D6753_09315 [Planctomycetota bacterium]|nr:MAG: hypothetical protein D6753_09315 [Planctomycetota bacterium]
MRKTAQWDWPAATVYQEFVVSYLEQQQASEEVRRRVESYWPADVRGLRGPELLDRVLASGAAVDARVNEVLVRLADPLALPPAPRDLPWLATEVPGWLQDALRLACGRAFAQRKMYDEALESMAGIQVDQVCDPGSLLFYRALSEHHLLQPEACLEDVDLLLQRESELPVRYARLARLIRADLEGYEPESLDEVARLMRDVHRRLDLGRAGQLVREEEQKIVEKLDKLIEQIEQQMQQQQQQQSQSQGADQQSQSRPMEESQIAGGSGPGDVDKKDTGQRSGWGNLPPAQRQEALQRLTEQLPSHYRDVIEGYFRELAKQDR